MSYTLDRALNFSLNDYVILFPFHIWYYNQMQIRNLIHDRYGIFYAIWKHTIVKKKEK